MCLCGPNRCVRLCVFVFLSGRRRLGAEELRDALHTQPVYFANAGTANSSACVVASYPSTRPADHPQILMLRNFLKVWEAELVLD